MHLKPLSLVAALALIGCGPSTAPTNSPPVQPAAEAKPDADAKPDAAPAAAGTKATVAVKGMGSPFG